MKKAVIVLGLIGAIFIAIGVIFKMQHWPGASVALLIGAVSLFFYSLIFMYERLQFQNTGIGKTFVIFFGISGALLPASFLLKVMHWPAANIFIYSFFVTYIGLLIVSITRAANEQDKELQYRYLNNFVWLLGGILILSFPVIIRFFGA